MEQLLSQDGASAGASQLEDRTAGAASGLESGGAMADLMAPQGDTGGGASADAGSAFDGAPALDSPLAAPRTGARPAAKPIGGNIGAGPPAKEIALPDFPWPPPTPSERMDVPPGKLTAKLGAKPSLAAIGNRLSDALNAAEYSEFAFFHAPGGFALVARLEQIEADGTPVAQHRFLPPNTDPAGFALTSYLKQLFFAPQGFYRLIVFVVTDRPVIAKGPAPPVGTAEAWLRQGADLLPPVYGTMAFTAYHRVSALIYEFRKSGSTDVSTLSPGRLDARTHLVKAGLYVALTGGP